jgi:hypothetical protein
MANGRSVMGRIHNGFPHQLREVTLGLYFKLLQLFALSAQAVIGLPAFASRPQRQDNFLYPGTRSDTDLLHRRPFPAKPSVTHPRSEKRLHDHQARGLLQVQ